MRVLGQREASIPYAQPSTHPRQPEKLVFLPVRLAIESSYTESVEAERGVSAYFKAIATHLRGDSALFKGGELSGFGHFLSL
jgi:hypothetical protein